MGQLNHPEYYRSRAATSRQLAERALNPEIAAIHEDLAARYEILFVELDRTPATRIVQTG